MRKLLMSYSGYLFLNNLIKSMHKIQTFKQSLPSFSKAMSASYPIKGPSGHLRYHITDITGIHPSVRLFRMQALGNGRCHCWAETDCRRKTKFSLEAGGNGAVCSVGTKWPFMCNREEHLSTWPSERNCNPQCASRDKSHAV